MPIDYAAITEALRRRTGQQPSGAGIATPAAVATTPQTPLPPSFADRSQPQPNPTANQDMSAPTVQTLGKQKGEAQVIVQALNERLKKLSEMGQ